MIINRKVLLVENGSKNNKSICGILRQSWYDYRSAGSVKEALERVRVENYDIILCDLLLPDGSGLDLLRALNNYLFTIPFVVLTGNNSIKLLKLALAEGASDYLPGPFNLDNLPTIIERNLERHKLSKERIYMDKNKVMLRAIKALITALEAKDSYTSGHSQRVAAWAKIMGEAIGLSEQDMFTLNLAALLHDIGKIGMPDKILHKSGSLLKMEYRTAKEHTVVGSKIVEEIDEMKEIASIIRHHHERYDGDGYPDGLQGDAIPLLARILAIVDTFEAIVSQRSYRAKQPSEIALEELAMHSGRQFDPKLVEVFISVFQKEEKQAMSKTGS